MAEASVGGMHKLVLAELLLFQSEWIVGVYHIGIRLI